MLSISNLPLPNVVQYWVSICKIKLEFSSEVYSYVPLYLHLGQRDQDDDQDVKIRFKEKQKISVGSEKRKNCMGLIEIASNNSVWRGMDYYNNKKVVSWESYGTDIYEGMVSGSDGNTYTVHIDTEHPKRSSCNCPFADGRRVVCKHMITLYFTVKPKVADGFLEEVEKWEAEEERELQHYEEMKKYVKSFSKAELQEQLLDALTQLEERRNY